MIVGVPREIKAREYRVGLVPASVRELVAQGHNVLVEQSAGIGIGIDDEVYRQAGATLVDHAETIFTDAELIVKVKEPQPSECKLLHEQQVLFTYLHLAPDPQQAELLQKSGCTAIAYETVSQPGGGLPLLAPMSQVAGRMSIQAGAFCLEKAQGGCGVLLGGVPGVASANVVVIGGGVVGTNAARMAIGLEAHVTVLDNSLHRLQVLDYQFGSRLNTVFATTDSIESYMLNADLVIGAVLVPGSAAPKLADHKLIAKMKTGAVIVDVAIDQGGCFATSRPTTPDVPTYIEHGVVHYCVTNMPGAVARTSTFALNNATLPFVIQLANKGVRSALMDDPYLREGLNIHRGLFTHKAVANDLGYEYVVAQEALTEK